MTLRVNTDITSFDPYALPGTGMMNAWMEFLVADDWTLDPSVFSYSVLFRPDQYLVGNLADKWEFSDPSTLVFHIHKGVYWQNIPPANGREFNANDVVFDYQRMYGLGSSMTKSPFWSSVSPMGQDLVSAVATNDYTVVFKWKTPNPEVMLESMEPQTGNSLLVNPEAVKQWGDLSDWHHAIGTGPFLLTDFVSGSSMTLDKNPNYWGHDQRYPQNQLPYINQLKILVIADDATANAAMRTGQIDVLNAVSVETVKDLKNTNPQIALNVNPDYTASSVDMRNDLKPFSDINVRKALQMSINLPELASTYYQGTVPPDPLTLSSYAEKGYGFPYDQWPQSLKDEYAYNVPGAKALLTAAGYPTGFDTDLVAANSLDSSLLQIIQGYFAAINVRMTIRVMDPPTLTQYVRVNHSQDAMSMWTTGSLGFTFEFSFQLGEFSTGAYSNDGRVSDSVFDAFQGQALAATTIDQFKQVIKNANERVAEQHYSISLLQTNTNTLTQPWVKGYSGQSTAFVDLVGFYCSRFWIDKTTK
jgi:peptide/nickel transport system substrate-binding protein